VSDNSLGLSESSPLRAALHAIAACAGQAAQHNSAGCGAAALGAATASLINGLANETDGGASTLTNEQKEARKNLLTNLIAGMATAAGSTQTSAAVTAATIETENNGLVEIFIPRNLPKLTFQGRDANGGILNKTAAVDKERQRITLIQPSETLLYAAGTGGDAIPGYTVIFAHASEGSIQGVDANNPATFLPFVEMIRNSGAWTPGQPLLLEACNSGKIDDGFASALALALGSPVTAPSSYAWNFPSFSTSGFRGTYDESEWFGGKIPALSKPGVWRTFGSDGKLTATTGKIPGAK
jgi:hypothetical protein